MTTKKDGAYTIPNVVLEPFERAVYAREHEKSGKMLLDILQRLRLGAGVVGYVNDEQTLAVLYTRLAACITTLISDPSFQLTKEGFDKLASEHATIDAIFRSSAFESSDHLARQFSDFTPENPNAIRFRNSPNLVKFLLTYSLSSRLRMDFEKLFRVDNKLTFSLYAGMLSHLTILNDASFTRREFLMKLSGLFQDVKIEPHILPILSDAYMYCSYATLRTKHHVKKAFNRMMKKLVRQECGTVDPDHLPMRPKRDKPLMLVPVEWFTSLHAMYRCYAPALLQLRQRYHLVGMGRQGETDEKGRSVFHEWRMLPDTVRFKELILLYKEIAPDIIFYPSVGMSYWNIGASVCRLAPIQILGVGHPATTMSEEMDYMVVEENIVGADDLTSETIIEIPTGATRYVMREDVSLEKIEHADLLPQNGVINVAVPAMAAKITTPFVKTLMEIDKAAAAAGKQVCFVMMPNVLGVSHFIFEKEMKRVLRKVVVEKRLHYHEYQRILRRCVLHLSPYPFGGTNSNIDSMLLGIPIVALEGEEPHASVDAQMLRRIGMGEWVAKTPEEYIRLAAELILNEDTRLAVGSAMRAAPVRSTFFTQGDDGLEWLKAIQFIEHVHETGGKLPKRIRLNDRRRYYE